MRLKGAMECGSLLPPYSFTRFPFPVARFQYISQRETGNLKRGTIKAAASCRTPNWLHGYSFKD
jgi:hypothetical protein